jgi:hypothetical protein
VEPQYASMKSSKIRYREEDMQEPLNNGDRTADGKFAPGNTFGKGRPVGARNKASLMAEVMLDNEAEALTRKLIDLALGGDLTAIKLCLERIIPPRKERPIIFDLSEIKTSEDVYNARSSILDAITTGEITAHEATNLCTLIDEQLKISKEKERDRTFGCFL